MTDLVIYNPKVGGQVSSGRSGGAVVPSSGQPSGFSLFEEFKKGFSSGLTKGAASKARSKSKPKPKTSTQSKPKPQPKPAPKALPAPERRSEPVVAYVPLIEGSVNDPMDIDMSGAVAWGPGLYEDFMGGGMADPTTIV